MLIRNVSSQVLSFKYGPSQITLQPWQFFELYSLALDYIAEVRQLISSGHIDIINDEFENYNFNNFQPVKNEPELDTLQEESIFKNLKLKRDKSGINNNHSGNHGKK